MGVLARQPARADMFRVAANMNETYYGEDVQQRKSNLDAPRVTINNHRMTNVQLPGGQVVLGIRRNNDLGYENQPPVAFESEQPMRPLRYTPGLKCDPALEAMRPERSMKHQALQGGDQWKKKLIQHPQTYEGSFADADMQQFRPYPNPNGRPRGAIPPARPADGRDADADAGRLRCQRRADQDQDEEPSLPAVGGCRPGPVRTSNASCPVEGSALDATGSTHASPDGDGRH